MLQLVYGWWCCCAVAVAVAAHEQQVPSRRVDSLTTRPVDEPTGSDPRRARRVPLVELRGARRGGGASAAHCAEQLKQVRSATIFDLDRS